MSAEMMVKAWKTPDLTPSERLVLLALADCANRVGTNAFVGERTISEHTQLGMSTVKLAIKQLKAKGHVVVQEIPTNRRSTTYRLFPNIDAESGRPNAGDDADSGRPGSGGPRVQNLDPHGSKCGSNHGSKCGSKSAVPYKEDPVDPVDPVDPGSLASPLQQLLTKFALEQLANAPNETGAALLEHLRLVARSRGFHPTPAEMVGAVDAALAEVGRPA